MTQINLNEVFNNQHTFVCGQTRSGKTYFVTHALQKASVPCLFFNPQYEKTGFCRVNGDYNMDDIIDALKDGEKLDFYPSTSLEYAQKQLDYMIDYIFANGGFEKPFVFAVDECHLYATQGQKSKHVNRIATGGHKFGFRGVFISQDPATVDKVLLRQSSRHIFYKLDMYNREYIANKGFDFEKIDKMNGLKESHIGVLCDFGEIVGTIKI